MSDLLEVRDLRVRYGAAAAVDGVSISLVRGGALGLVGESGSGKSTLALALAGLLPRDAVVTGSVCLAGEELIGATPARLRAVRGRRVAYVFQDPMASLNPYLRIVDQVAEALAEPRDARAQVTALLERVRIPAARSRLDHYPHQLSGGQRQRVMLAMALAGQPDLLVADEPTTALDVTVQAQVLALIRELRRDLGLALLLVSHDLGVIAGECEHVAVMHQGRLVETADTNTLFASPREAYTRALLAAVPRLA